MIAAVGSLPEEFTKGILRGVWSSLGLLTVVKEGVGLLAPLCHT